MGADTEAAFREFGKAQRESVEGVIGELDASLRDLMKVLGRSVENSDEFADMTSRSTGRLAKAMESESLTEVRSALRQEVRELAQSLKDYREASREIHKNYESELESMYSRMKVAEEHARTDALTQLPNRMAHEFYLKAIIQKAQVGSTYAVAMVDIDEFKSINDTWGHSVGDEVLSDFGGRLKSEIGRSGFVSRLGGDEFTVVAKLSSEKLSAKLSRLREELKSRPLKTSVKSLEYSISFGVMDIYGDESYHDLMKEVDRLMYLYKRKSKGNSAA